jgi:pyruvate,water dikinase
LGIDSISLNPDSVLKTLLDVAKVEASTSMMDLVIDVAQV